MSDHGRRNEDKIIPKIQKLLPLLITLFTVIGTYFTLKNTIDNADKLATQTAVIVQNHAERIARLEFIADSLPEMRKDMKKLLLLSARIDRRNSGGDE